MPLTVFQFYDLAAEVARLRNEVKDLTDLVRQNNNMFVVQFGQPEHKTMQMRSEFFEIKGKLSKAIAELEAELLQCTEVHEEVVHNNTYPNDPDAEKEPYFKGRMDTLERTIKLLKEVKKWEE